MATLPAADLAFHYTQILRGFEADLARAEIVAEASPDDEQLQDRVAILRRQIEVTEGKLADTQKEVVEATDPAAFDDDYESLTKAQLLERAEGESVPSNAKKADIITILRARDVAA